MNKAVQVLVEGVLSIGLGASAVGAEVVRPGDQLNIKLDSAFNAAAARSGDGFAVTVPTGLQADPSGSPEIPPGTAGTATFKLVERSSTAIKFDISSLRFTAKAGLVEIKTALAAADATAGTLTIKKASVIKKLLIPPIVGFLIWKDSATLPAGKEISIEVAEQKRW